MGGIQVSATRQITLHLATRNFVLVKGTQAVHCAFLPNAADAIPGPGRYLLSAPHQNSAYGTFALMSLTEPVSGRAALGWVDRPSVGADWVGRQAVGADWVGRQAVRVDWVGRQAVRADWVGRQAAGVDWVGRQLAGVGWVRRTWLTEGWLSRPLQGQVEQAGVFVLVGKPFVGRNGLLITTGFAELMASLKETDGSAITVA